MDDQLKLKGEFEIILGKKQTLTIDDFNRVLIGKNKSCNFILPKEEVEQVSFSVINMNNNFYLVN